MLEPIKDHVEEGRGLLLEQYKGKPRLDALLASYTRQVQKLEDAVWSVILGRMLENAVGVQLDKIGKIVGQPRLGEPDVRYRMLIQVRIAINRSSGYPDEIVNIVRLVCQAPFAPHAFEFDDELPGTGFRLIFLDPPTDGESDAWDLIFGFVLEASAAGVGFSIVWPTVDSPDTFDADRVFRYGDDTLPNTDDVLWAYGDDSGDVNATGGRMLHAQSTSTTE
jgi:hypothetical protein